MKSFFLSTAPVRSSVTSLIALLVSVLLLLGCAREMTRSSSSYASDYAASEATSRRIRPPTPSAPGLGTGWGEERDSSIRRTDFVRASSAPAAVEAIYYNDREGIDAMLDYVGGSRRRARGWQPMAGGLVRAAVRSGDGRWLEGWTGGGRRFVAGERNDRYELVLRNETRRRIEVVLSVDGLDVMDGRPASFSKRGYIVWPGDTLTVDGFRTSAETVAAFRFRPVDRSYAALKHGDTRNVGVIGIAVFTERQSTLDPANPFPGSRWATPPRE